MKKLKLKENEVVHCANFKEFKKVCNVFLKSQTMINRDTYNGCKEYSFNVFIRPHGDGFLNIVNDIHEWKVITSKEFIKRHKKKNKCKKLEDRINILEAIVNGTNESKEAEQPQIGDVVKAWDNDKSKFVYGVYNGREEHEVYYIVGEAWYENIEKVTEISINDFKK